MNDKMHRFGVPHMQRNLFTGALILMPLLVTWVVFDFLFGQLAAIGAPWVPVIFRSIYGFYPKLAEWLFTPWVEYAIAVTLSLVMLYFLGWAATRVLGRRILAWLESLVKRIPLVQTIYGSTKMLLEAFQTKPDGTQRVVLIDFPSPDMRTVGFVMHILVDETTGEELAVVYVPSAPSPTSGYIEIVPVTKITPTDWTMEEAMRFILTGGISGPGSIAYTKRRGTSTIRTAARRAVHFFIPTQHH